MFPQTKQYHKQADYVAKHVEQLGLHHEAITIGCATPLQSAVGADSY
jgi:hypothetical protein